MSDKTKRKPSYTVRLNEVEEEILEFLEAELGFGSTAEAIRHAVKYLYIETLYGMVEADNLDNDEDIRGYLKNILGMLDIDGDR